MAHVKSYVRVVNGKSINVTQYDNAVNKKNQMLSTEHGRPPISAQPGAFPQGRKWPGIFAEHSFKPDAPVFPDKKSEDAAKAEAEKLGMKVTPPQDPQVSEAVDKLRAAGHDVTPLKGADAKQFGSDKAKTAASARAFIHPKTKGEANPTVVPVPEGGHVSQHKKVPDTYLVHDASGKPTALVNRSGRAQKPPPNLQRKNYQKIDHTHPDHGGPDLAQQNDAFAQKKPGSVMRRTDGQPFEYMKGEDGKWRARNTKTGKDIPTVIPDATLKSLMETGHLSDSKATPEKKAEPPAKKIVKAPKKTAKKAAVKKVDPKELARAFGVKKVELAASTLVALAGK